MENQKDRYQNEEYQLELENRIRNLMWTVSGNYGLNANLDVDSYHRSKYISMYDAIKQGAFARFFDTEELAMYLAKKVYLGGDEGQLLSIAQLCADAASYRRIMEERAGVPAIREKALEDIAEIYFSVLTSTMMGRVKLALIRYFREGEYRGDKITTDMVNRIASLENAKDTMEIIRVVDGIYNDYLDKTFERKHGGLEKVLAVTLRELAEGDWSELLNDELYEDAVEQVIQNISTAVTSLSEQEEKKQKKTEAERSVVYLDETALARLYSYVELNYGKSYLTKQEEERLNRSLCRGLHADCSLFFTDGILHSTKLMNYQVKYAEKQAYKNKMAYYDNHRVVKRNIAVLTDILKKALVLRSEMDSRPSDHGAIRPNRLWRVGRTRTDKLFDQIIKRDDTDFVVDVLIDGSGSQSPRQAKVALQGYILSEALSNLEIPHRIMSFCTFWDYTILHRFRDYGDERAKNARLFE